MGIYSNNLGIDNPYLQNDFADRLIENYNQDDPRKPQYDITNDEKAQAIADQIRQGKLNKQVDDSSEEITRLTKSLEYDPRKKAHQDWKSRYKWKGASPLRKLGSIGMGVADVLSAFSKDGTIYQDYQKAGQSQYNDLQQNVNNQITNQQKLASNANTVLEKMDQDRQKKENNLAQIELKKLLDKTSNPTEAIRIQQAVAQMEREGTLTAAKVANLGARTGLTNTQNEVLKETGYDPKNPYGAASRLMKMKPEEKTGYLENFEAIQKAIAKGRPERQFAPRTFTEGGPQHELSIDPVSQEVSAKMVTPRTAFAVTPTGMTQLPQPEGMTGPNSTNARLTPAEFKIFSDMDKTAKLLRSASTNILSDIANNNINAYSGFNDSHVGRILNGLFEDNPQIAAARALGPQQASIATLQHLKAMYGGRAPQALAQDLDQLIAGKMANGLGKASAIMSQQLIAEMFLLSQAKDPRASKLFSDPNFYQFLKQNSVKLIKDAENSKQLGLLTPQMPNAGMLMNKYLEKNQPQQNIPRIVKKPNAFFNEGMKFQPKVKP